jgi:nucleoside 2-deoxyribosyltransferase
MLKMIRSGGQTGADRAGLDVALLFDIPHGGWCPQGKTAEDGVLADKYKLMETDSEDVNLRTMKNIEEADATIVFVPCWPLPLTIQDGTSLTITYAKALQKPLFWVNLSAVTETIVDDFIHWLDNNKIHSLNVAGLRESNCQGMYQRTFDLFSVLLQAALHK